MLVEGKLYTITQLYIYFAMVALNLGYLCLGIMGTDNFIDGFGNDACGDRMSEAVHLGSTTFTVKLHLAAIGEDDIVAQLHHIYLFANQ